MGAAFDRLGRDAEGVRAYREAIRVDPEFAPAHFAMGAAMLKKGDKIEALDQFKILKKLDSELADNLFNRIYPNDEPAQKTKRASKQPRP
jgi:tetratricopeptide (TPR) repeat protein